MASTSAISGSSKHSRRTPCPTIPVAPNKITFTVPRSFLNLAAKNYKFAFRKRRALAITETELRLIAALASMGLSSQPKKG